MVTVRPMSGSLVAMVYAGCGVRKLVRLGRRKASVEPGREGLVRSSGQGYGSALVGLVRTGTLALGMSCSSALRSGAGRGRWMCTLVSLGLARVMLSAALEKVRLLMLEPPLARRECATVARPSRPAPAAAGGAGRGRCR